MEIVVVSFVTFLAATLTFFSGFGLGTILTPVMMIFFPVEAAIAFTGIVHFSNNIFKLFIIGNNINKEVLVKFGVPAVLTAFLGSWVLFNINNNIIFYSYEIMDKIIEVSLINVVISILLILFALIDLVPFFKNLKFDNKLPLGGFLSGFFGGLTGNQGALRSAFLIKLGLKKKVFIGTTVVISTTVDFARLSVYWTSLSNTNVHEYYSVAIFAIISGISGSLIGNSLLRKVTLSFIRTLVAVLILLIAFALLTGII
jgi:uncharacterized membrane protein YfcA